MSAKKVALPECGNCGSTENLSNCGRCKITQYCCSPCQKQHWANGHAQVCKSPDERSVKQETCDCCGIEGKQSVCARCKIAKYCSKACQSKQWKSHKPNCSTEKCSICLECLTVETVTFICGHTFHTVCATNLSLTTTFCPLCRVNIIGKTLTCLDGRTGTYMGAMTDGIANGLGVSTFPGETYSGEFKNCLYHGQGVMNKNGSIYDGEWKHGNPDGYGVKTHDNGDVYTGSWKEGWRHGAVSV